MSFLIFRTSELEPGKLDLTSEEVRHVKSRRLRVDDAVYVGDGIDGRFQARFLENMKSVMILDERPEMRAEPIRIVCTALPSGNRLDWMLQKATELGATHIIPLQTNRSARNSMSLDRAKRIIHEAAVQSERFFLPLIYAPVDLKNSRAFIAKNISENANCSFLYTGNARPFTEAPCEGPTAFFIGPEGDFDTSEIIFFEENGILPYSLGKTILKVETAVIAALSILAVKSI